MADGDENQFKFDEDPNSPANSPREKKKKDEPNSSESPEKSKLASPRKPIMMVAASPPTFVSMEEIMKAADGVTNMALAHEIVVDPDFRFNMPEKPDNSLEKRVGEMMRRAFWDLLQEELSRDPPCYSQALHLLQELKESVTGLLLPQHARFRSQIDEVLDLDLIKQKAENDVIDVTHYAGFVIDIMAQLCAPARDQEVADLKKLTNVVELYKGVFQMLDILKMDMANFTVQQIRPYLQQQSIEYERKKFTEFIEQQGSLGIDGLEITKTWLKSSLERAQAECASQVGAAAAPTITPFTVLNNAYLSLLDWSADELFPETLVMDANRFALLGKQYNWLSLVTSIMLVTYNTVGASISGIAELKTALKEQITVLLRGVKETDLVEAMKSIAVQLDKLVNDCLVKHGFKALDAERSHMLTSQIEQLHSSDHVVHKLMSNRIKTFLGQVMSSSKPNEVQVPSGCSAMTKELSHVTGKFLRIVSHNRSVFGQIYANILKDLLPNSRTASS